MDIDIIKNYDTTRMLKEFTDNLNVSQKNSIKYIITRNTDNTMTRCSNNKCKKYAKYINLNNNESICWYHAYINE